jgi:hypothetical protein
LWGAGGRLHHAGGVNGDAADRRVAGGGGGLGLGLRLGLESLERGVEVAEL